MPRTIAYTLVGAFAGAAISLIFMDGLLEFSCDGFFENICQGAWGWGGIFVIPLMFLSLMIVFGFLGGLLAIARNRAERKKKLTESNSIVK